ncbi:MAG: hypothetical protein NTY19_02965, partial [Planctomycetota bacterium]|nr:hypothetical protein [Planctomycetota bacterium]
MLSGFSLFGPASLLTRVRRTPKRREQQRLRTRRRLLLEQLEDRRLLAIDLKYEGPWSKLELSENATAGPDVVNVSNAAVPGLLRIDLGLTATFGGLSSPTASGLHYQFGSPTTSHWADIDLTSAGDVDTVSINTGDGNDTINVALSSPYVNNIEINPGAGSVTTTFIGGPTSVAGYVNVVAAAINLRASVTSGELTLDGPVTLTAPVTLSGASGTFKGTVQGPGNLTLNFTNATFEQAVGDGTALTPLTPIGDGSGPAITFVAGSSATFWSKVRTNSGIVEEGGSGWVTFQDNVTIVGGDTVTTFDGSVTLDGLLFTSDGAVTFGTAGDIDMLFVTTTPVTIDTTSAGVAGGAVTFNTISQLERNLTVLGKSTVEVTNTMDSFFLDGEAQLSITAPTSVTVAAGGVVGSVMKLGAVSINSGAVMLNDSVFTDGALVTLAGTGAITLATGKTITTTPVTDGGAGGAIVINATTVTGNVDLVGSLVTSGKSNATGPGGAGGLVTIATVNGTIAINTITTSGGSSANPGSNGGLAGSISLNTGSGNLITLNGNLTAEGGNGAGTGNGGAGGAVTLNDNVRLGADIAISTIPGTGGTPGLGGSVLVASGSTVNATGAGLQGLTVAAGSGSFTASGALGDSAALKSVDVTAANIALHNVTTTGTSPGYQHYHATTQIALDGAYNSAGAVITFDGPTVLNANTTVNTTNGGPATGADITFTGTLNDAAAFQHSLGLTSGTGGDVLFQGVVGATALGTVTVSVSADVVHASLAFTAASFTQTTGAGATTFDSTLTTKGANNTAGGMVSITTSGAVTVTGAIDSGGGNATTVGKAGGSVDLTGSTVAVNAITTNGSAAVSGAGGNAGAISITATVLNITLNGNVTALGGAGPPAGTAGTVTLTAVTGANQLGGFMKAANLRLLGSGTFTLDGAANDLAVIAADLNSAVNPGVVSFTDINDIEVGTVSGTNGIATGNPAAGGAVTINASGTITVNHPIDTSTGSGGGVSITGSVILNSGGTLTAAGGNITLHGSTDAASDLIIGADITSSTTMNLTAPRDILVRAKLETNGGTGSDIILTADSDHLPASGLGAGGVWVEAAGQLVSDDQVQLSGSDLFATGGGASPFDSVLVDGDSIVGTLQIDAAGSITIKDGDYAPSVADTIINGRVATTATATGGAILIRAQQDVLFGADGDVTGPSGTVTVTADWPAGNTGGGITMADGAVINAGSGDVALSADGNIALGQVQTTSPAGIAVNVSTTSGAISDNTAAETFNISALGTVTLSAKTGIGVSGTTASIEFSAPTMNATNTTSVGIYLNSIGVGAVNFNTINAQTAGNIELRSANDTTLTSVTAGNGSIQALTAQGGGTFTNVAHVVSSTDADANDITITASNGNVRFTLAGAVNAGTTAGDVFITASSGAIVDVLSDTAIDVIGQDVSLTALGDIGQTGTAAIDTEAVNLTTSSNSSSVAGLHGTWINEFDGVTVISATTTDGLISLSSGGPMTIRTVNAATGGATVRNVNLVTTSGDVTIGDSGGGTITTSSTAAGYVRISAAGGIVDSHAGNDITTQNLLLRATTGIGSADSLDTTVSNLAATNVTTSGNIQIRNTIDLTITTVTTVTPFGDTLSGVANSAAGTIVIMATGAVTVDQAVSDSGGGNIILAAEGQAAVDDLTINANVTASGDGGSISLYAGDTIFVQGTPTVRTISAAGAGAVLLSASTDYHNNNPIRNGYDGNGTMAATAGRVVMHDGSIVQSQSGNITLRGDGNVLLSIVNAHNDVSGGAGYVIVTADYAGVDGGMSDYAGAISDNLTGEAVNITGDQVALRAGTGIGSGTAPDDLDIDVAINTLVAVTASGDINVQDVDATNLVGGLTIETFDGLHGVTISNADGTATLNDDITIRASSPVDVTAGDPVENFDGGNIKLAAEGATTGDDLTLYDNVTVTGGDGTIDGDGNIYLYAGHTINLMLAAVVVSVDASGSVLLSAGTNFNNGSPLDGNNTGDVLMTSGSTVSSEDGDLTLLAPNNVQLSIVNANADTPPDGVRGNIIVTADYGGPVTPGTYPSDNAGAISDILTAETANLTGNLATLLAATGIGSGGGDSDIETNLTTLNALNSISGDIAINEVAAGFDLVVQQATQNGTTGSISLTTERGNLTVLAAGSGVRLTNVANATGTISLDANVTVPATDEVTRGNVVVDQVVTSQGGSITITADHDVTGANTGDISSNGGAIGITADANTDGPGGNNNGTIQLKGDITAVGGSVTLSLADCDGWLGDATVVAVDGRILSALNIIKNGLGALRLNRAGNTYTGLTTVNDGTLIVNGTLTDSVAGGGVVVTDNATLGGNGTINAVVLVAASGTLDPGDCLADGAAPRCSPQPGKLTVTSAPPEGGSTVAFEFGATFRVQLNGLIPGQATVGPPVDGGYDQLAVNGTVDLGGTTPPGANGATLERSVGFPMPVGAAFRVINYDLTELVSNQFNELPEGSFFHAGSYVMNISYQSGLNNNDVTLTHPGRYDFDAYLPDTDPYYYESVGPMYPGNTAQEYSASTGVGWLTTGLNVLPQVTGRFASEGDSLGRNTYPVGASPSETPVRLLRDLHFTYGQAMFQVDAVAVDTMTFDPLLYQVLVTSGDYGLVHEHSEFTVSG